MNISDDQPKAFPALAEEFNNTVKAFFNAGAKNTAAEDGVTMDALLQKYSILSKYKTESPSDQGRLVEALFNCALDIVDRCAKPDFKETLAPHLTQAQTLLNTVTRTDELAYLPDTAADALVDRALNLVRKTEFMKSDYYWKDYAAHKTGLLTFSNTLLAFSDKLRGPAGNQPRFAAAKTVAPPAAKKLTLPAVQGSTSAM